MPSVPEGEKLDFGSMEFREFEDIGESTLHGLPKVALPLPAQSLPDAAHSKLQGTSSTGPCAYRAQQGQVTSARPNTGATIGAGHGWPMAHHTGQTGCNSSRCSVPRQQPVQDGSLPARGCLGDALLYCTMLAACPVLWCLLHSVCC